MTWQNYLKPSKRKILLAIILLLLLPFPGSQDYTCVDSCPSNFIFIPLGLFGTASFNNYLSHLYLVEKWSDSYSSTELLVSKFVGYFFDLESYYYHGGSDIHPILIFLLPYLIIAYLLSCVIFNFAKYFWNKYSIQTPFKKNK